jgi:hypothetical protein
VADVFNPLLPALAAGLIDALGVAYLLGRREEARLGPGKPSDTPAFTRELTRDELELRRPGRFWINVALVLSVLGAMLSGQAPPAACFMLGTALALVVNYPDLAQQRERVDAHARAALMMASILLAAGVFTGILQGTGMLSAMAQAASTCPRGWHAGGARPRRDAAQPAVRPDSSTSACCPLARLRHGRPSVHAARGAPRADDHGLPGESADAGHFPARRPRGRPGRAPEVAIPLLWEPRW